MGCVPILKRRFKTAFILGAGLGTRLRPLTERCPKPLLEIGGRPIITSVMDHLLDVGIDRFIVNTHHCPEGYKERFPDSQWRGVPIIFRHEPILLDTAGGLKNIEGLLEKDEAILCYNGDVITSLPLQGLLETHEQRRPEVTLALRSNGPLLNVNINEKGEILAGLAEERLTRRKEEDQAPVESIKAITLSISSPSATGKRKFTLQPEQESI